MPPVPRAIPEEPEDLCLRGSGLPGLTAPLWPIRYKPLPDELLSCWLIRLAHGHGLRVQTFCNLVFGSLRQVWNRDIDRLAPPWLLEELIRCTGTPRDEAYGSTLLVFEGTLFPKMKETGSLPWVQSLKVFHRFREGRGQQYCSACLAEDEVPYFRKTWRLSLSTYCLAHRCMLRDHCEACGASVNFHRVGMGKDSDFERPMTCCHECAHDLSTDPPRALPLGDTDACALVDSLLFRCNEVAIRQSSKSIADELAVLRHVTRLLLTSIPSVKLMAYAADALGFRERHTTTARQGIEQFDVSSRHEVLQQAAWLLVNFPVRIKQAWDVGAVRYNHLLKDFSSPPAWYLEGISSLNRGW
jgi:hypothetical protein